MNKRATLVVLVVAVFLAASMASFAADRKRQEIDERLAKIVKPVATEVAAPQTEAQQPTSPSTLEPTQTTLMAPSYTASPATGEQIKWQVIGGGGGSSSSASYKLSATIGQTAAGPIASASYKLNQGFWQNFAPTSCCVGTRGNVNLAGIIDVSDLSLLVAYLTQSPAPTLPCEPAANVNALGIVDVSDLSLLVAYLTSSPAPSLPPC